MGECHEICFVDLDPPCELILFLFTFVDKNFSRFDVVFLLFLNFKDIGTYGHPMHIHGTNFQVVDAGDLDQLASGGNPELINSSKNPPNRDTIAVPNRKY